MILTLLVALAVVTMPCQVPNHDVPAVPVNPLRANYLITVADDFIVDIYLNGKPVADSQRTLLEERFGATVERIDAPVHRGDCLVFNVVNNRLRWGGCRYFAVAGCFAANEFGFVSDRASRQWSTCDRPSDVRRFIAQKSYLNRRAGQLVDHPWSDGDALMRANAGTNWSGTPIWGSARNTWVKVVLE